MAASSPSETPACAAQTKLEGLRRQFHAGLAGRATALESAASVPELHAALHRLAGAAGCYGDQSLSDQARQLLSLIQRAEGHAIPAAARQPVQALCQACRALAALSQAGSPRPN